MKKVINAIRNIKTILYVLFIILMLELCFRIYYFGFSALTHPFAYNNRGMLFSNLPQSVPETDICYRIKPNLHTFFRGKEFNSNQYGFREKNDVSVQPHQDTLRVALLGRSVSMGAGVADKDIYSRQLDDILTSSLTFPVEVLNFSVGGYRYQQVVSAYEHYVKPFQPDIILWPVYYGEFQTLDTGCRRPENVQPKWDQLRGYLIDFFLDNAIRAEVDQELISSLASDWHSRGRAFPPQSSANYEQILQHFIQRRQQEHIPVVLVALPLPPVTSLQTKEENFDTEHLFLKQWAQQYDNVQVVDARLNAPRVTKQDIIYLGDFHPTGYVHHEYAKAIAPQLQPILEKIHLLKNTDASNIHNQVE